MLERLQAAGNETLKRVDGTVMRYLDRVLRDNPSPVVYEIGVGIGATTLPIAEKLANSGQIVLFSRENDVRELSADLMSLGFSNVVDAWGSPGRTYSGYHFELARGFVGGELPDLDLAYIDGGHVFHLDGSATAILKELCKPGGYLIFDDWYWTLEKSPTLNPEVRPETKRHYDQRQIVEPHVQLVCKALMDTDARFEFLELDGGTAVYRRTR